MGRKIFVTYKFGDTNVLALENITVTKVRDYVNVLQTLIKDEDHINKGENDDESLANFKDSTIESKLRNKIYDSSITIAVVSKGMKDTWLAERNQWMPWEISYSLKEHARDGRTSQTNAMLAVVLPDENGSYGYYIEEDTCTACHCRTLKTEFLFRIMRENMFNIKSPERSDCTNHDSTSKPYLGYSSYIHSVKWSDFKLDINEQIDIAYEIHSKIDDYDITKNLT